MAQQARTRYRTRKGPATRQRILNVARELFATYGYERTTIRAIATQLELTDPAIYYHFASKRILLDHVIEEFPQDQGILASGRVNEREEFARRVLEIFYGYSEKTEVVRLMFRQQYDFDPAAQERRISGRKRFHEAIGADLRHLYETHAPGIADGLRLLLSGALWDAMLNHGSAAGEVIQQEEFRHRIRALIDLALPEMNITPAQWRPR